MYHYFRMKLDVPMMLYLVQMRAHQSQSSLIVLSAGIQAVKKLILSFLVNIASLIIMRVA